MSITVECTGCQKSFRLRDEMAGRKVRCPECEAILFVPAAEPEELLFQADSDEGAPRLHPALDRDRFLLRQKLMTLSEKYVVCDDQERPILYVERPAHFWRNILAAFATVMVFVLTTALSIAIGVTVAQRVSPNWIGYGIMVVLILLSLVAAAMIGIKLTPKRHISFFSDETKQSLLLQVLQDHKIQLIVATYTVLTPDGRNRKIMGRMREKLPLQFLFAGNGMSSTLRARKC